MKTMALLELKGYQFGSVKLETEKSGDYYAVFTGYVVFTVNGKKQRRKLQDITLYNESRYIVRYKNALYFLPYNIGSVLKQGL
jgi:hypothetical protein